MNQNRPLSLADQAAALVIFLVLALLLSMLCIGCSGISFPPIELCLDHPRFGQVCATVVDGKVTFAAKLTGAKERLSDEEQLALEAWIQERGGAEALR